MKHIGKLDKNKLGEYKDKILTDKVILTNERIKHIKEHHLGDFEQYGVYIYDAIQDPDYILEDNKNIDTVLYMKTVEENQKNIQIVIKLSTNIKNKNKYNSILTFWKIKNSSYNQLIRNRKTIWKKQEKR